MEKMRITLLFMVLSLLFVGCTNHSNTDNNKEDHSSHGGEDAAASIALNNGEKWKVNEEMKPFIRESKATLDEYIERNSADYKTLATQLKEKNTKLIKSCTMKGKSHDELHKWLHPHMALIETLGKAQNTEEANTIISKLEKSFETYNQYFQ